MADVLKPTISIKAQGDEFVFRVPSPLDKARQGAREASIRKMLDPTGQGWADGYDLDTFYLIRGMAVLELFLDQSSAKWVWTESKADKDAKAGRVYVAIDEFPAGKEDVITEVGREFQLALDRFHGRGAAAGQRPASEDVESGGDSGALRPVAPAPAGSE
jgi:hypothetical protein